MPAKNSDDIKDLFTIKIDLILILIHFLLTCIFSFINVWQMASLNILSIALYLILFFLLKNSKLKSKNYYIIATLEIILQISFATYFVGWETGFYLYCFGIIFVMYYISSLAIHQDKVKLTCKIITYIAIISLFIIRITACYVEPVYKLKSGITAFFFTMNALETLFIITHFMRIFSRRFESWETHLSNLAQKDALTNIFNRYKMRDFFSVLKEGFDEHKFKFAVIIVDIDDFKHFNDTYGHEAGDFILVELAHIFLSFCHKYTDNDYLSLEVDTDDLICCRWGGEEFLFAKTFTDDFPKNPKKMLDLFEAVRTHDFKFRNEHFKITLTGGMAEHIESRRIDETISFADMNLYKGKENGKNQLVF